MATIEDIKQLREETGVGPVDVKKALEEANGDVAKAKEILRARGKAIANKKTSKETKAGLVKSYIHQNARTGVLLDIRCETDFVANSEDFKTLANEICLQVAAMRPLFVSDAEIPEVVIEAETKIYQEQLKDSGKPEAIMAQILEGKLNKFKAEVCLLSQTWIKDDTKTIKNLVEDTVGKVGENIEVKHFARYEI